MTTTDDGTPAPIFHTPTPRGGVPLDVLARYTVSDLVSGHPDFARLASGPGQPVMAATCRRPHLEGDDDSDRVVRRAGVFHLLGVRENGGPSTNLADLAQLALEHEVDHHGDPAACRCPNLPRSVGGEPQEIDADPDCPLHGDPATALSGLAAQAAQEAHGRCREVLGDDVLPALRDAAHTGIGYALAAMAGAAVEERATLEGRLAQMAALPLSWNQQVDGGDAAAVLARIGALSAGFNDRRSRAEQIGLFHAYGVCQAAAEQIAAAMGLPKQFDYDHGASVFAAALTRLADEHPTAAGVDWARYARRCPDDLPLDGLGDLCLFLGGTWSEKEGGGSFNANLLKLFVKAQTSPEYMAPLCQAFPIQATAWRTWIAMDPTPTAAALAAALSRGSGGLQAPA
jgi:hypothetical protein